jgi:hypothetical protein
MLLFGTPSYLLLVFSLDSRSENHPTAFECRHVSGCTKPTTDIEPEGESTPHYTPAYGLGLKLRTSCLRCLVSSFVCRGIRTYPTFHRAFYGLRETDASLVRESLRPQRFKYGISRHQKRRSVTSLSVCIHQTCHQTWALKR